MIIIDNGINTNGLSLCNGFANVPVHGSAIEISCVSLFMNRGCMVPYFPHKRASKKIDQGYTDILVVIFVLPLDLFPKHNISKLSRCGINGNKLFGQHSQKQIGPYMS